METKRISEVVQNVNYSYLLPAIQREFVWETDDIVDLFDSLLRDYPIGALLQWNLSADAAESQPKYQFVTHYINEPSFPPSLTTPTHRNPPYESDDPLPSPVKLVLDGQQRLTALNIGLKGSYFERKHGHRRDTASSWVQKRLYLNLLSDPTTVDSELGNKYDFSFRAERSVTRNAYWYPVNRILSISDSDEFYSERQEIERRIRELVSDAPDGKNPDSLVLNAQRNFEDLHRAVHKDEKLHFFTEDEDDITRVRDVFVRINQGGVTPNRSEILLSLMTSCWQQEPPAINARDEVHSMVDELNGSIDGGNSPFNTKHVQKVLLASNENEIQYRFDNYTLELLRELKEIWLTDTFETTMNQLARLFESYYPTVAHILSPALYTPVAYYLYQNGNPSLDPTSVDGRERRESILYYICAARLNGFTRQSSNQIAERVRDVIRDSEGTTFPIDEISEEVESSYGSSLRFTDEKIETLFEELRYGKRGVQFLLQLSHYPDEPARGKDYEIDHIIPKSVLPDDADADRVGNLQLLVDKTNRMKSDDDFQEWLRSRTESYRTTHHIPDGATEMTFEEFVEHREQQIKAHILDQQPL
ncbi:DUF262 domain-containing protein [Natrinema longum]|uniref:DUF262 domain-containing protein n=1 Tax=Natrinema longum TaxID=370324 RepID=A0A8A2U9A8_9EURY|nr:DUF262 domain-containing protein [Natrinema longum]MBZ6493439.1 DUF262 domain-containing protein [Natrinema longum]QSW85214.1 DUF262 domain-containing protein [Natrinema longum]